MNLPAQYVANASNRAPQGTGFLYGWLLLALFVEYARPTNQLKFLEFPFFYSLVPMLLLLVTLVVRGLRPMKEIFADPMAKWVPIFFGVIAVSWLVSGMRPAGTTVLQAVLGYVFLFILIARIVTTEARLKGVFAVLVGAHLYLLAMNFQVLTNPAQRQYLTGGTFLGDGNDFALSLCVLFPCMIAVALGARSLFGKLLALGAASIMPLAIVATQSRGGTLGMVTVLIYLWMRSGRKMASLIAIAMVGVLVLVYAPPEYFQRMGTVSNAQTDTSAQGRLDAWSGSIGMGLKNPLGIGVGGFSARWGRTAHSTYFLALGELGLAGFFCVLMLVLGNLKANVSARRQALARAGPAPDEAARRSLQMLDMMNASMVGFAVAGAFLSATYYPHMYVMTALLISARIFVARQAGWQPAQVLTNTRMLPNAGPPQRIQRNQK